MERLSFGPESALSIADPHLEATTIAPLTLPMTRGSSAQAAVFRIAPGGRIRRHPATVPQILAVLEGAGEVSGADGVFHPVRAGDAVAWLAGEPHETRTDTGLTALILEAAGLMPAQPRTPR